MNPKPPPSPLALGALVFALTWAVYAPAIHFDFVNYDDPLYVTELDWVKDGLSWSSFKAAWTTRVAGNWHPLTMLSHLLDTTLYGLDPRGHHASSIFLHALNATVLFAMFRALFGGLLRPFLAAALFALHPFNVDSAVWIAERKNLLSSFFWFAATWSYVHFVRRKSLPAMLATIVLFACGLMAKPMLVTFPLTLLMLDVWPLRRVDGCSVRHLPQWINLIREKSTLLMMTLLFSVFTIVTQFPSGYAHTPDPQPLWARALFALQHYQMYLEKFLWPTGLSVLYPRLEMPPDFAAVGRAAALLAAITIGTFLLRKKTPALLFGWLWFAGTMFPVCGIVEIGQHSITDRYMYVPMVGLIIAVVWAWPVARFRAAGVAAGLAALIALGAATRALLPHWRDSETLFRRAVTVTSDNFIMMSNLGQELIKQGRTAEAHQWLSQALEINPRHAAALSNMGLVLLLDGRHVEATPYFEQSILHQPRNTSARLGLAGILMRERRYREAAAQYEMILRLDPGSINAREGWMHAQQAMGVIVVRP